MSGRRCVACSQDGCGCCGMPAERLSFRSPRGRSISPPHTSFTPRRRVRSPPMNMAVQAANHGKAACLKKLVKLQAEEITVLRREHNFSERAVRAAESRLQVVESMFSDMEVRQSESETACEEAIANAERERRRAEVAETSSRELQTRVDELEREALFMQKAWKHKEEQAGEVFTQAEELRTQVKAMAAELRAHEVSRREGLAKAEAASVAASLCARHDAQECAKWRMEAEALQNERIASVSEVRKLVGKVDTLTREKIILEDAVVCLRAQVQSQASRWSQIADLTA